MSIPDPFFRLTDFENCTIIEDQKQFIILLDKKGREIKNLEYRPSNLISIGTDRIPKIKDRHFTNVSFARTTLKGITFEGCDFTDCRFHFSEIIDCRFHNCTFLSTNMHHVKISNTYVEPHSFKRATPDKKKYANIGVHLFQMLMRNSRNEDQPERESRARFLFKRWQRFEKCSEYQKLKKENRTNFNFWFSKFKMIVEILGSWVWEIFFGFGVRLRNFLLTGLGLIIILTIINYCSREIFGLDYNGVPLSSINEAFYFTVISLTTVGYGDIVPTTQFGRIVMAAEGVIGFGMFGVLISMLFRKIAP